MNNSPSQKQNQKQGNVPDSRSSLKLQLISFGYKNGPPPLANLVLDVRFLKNPYWVKELRPLTGRDAAVRAYVLDQELAGDVLETVDRLIAQTLPVILNIKEDSFTVALGCTGGQHRSTAMVEALHDRLREQYPDLDIEVRHRELDSQDQDGDRSDAGQLQSSVRDRS